MSISNQNKQIKRSISPFTSGNGILNAKIISY